MRTVRRRASFRTLTNMNELYSHYLEAFKTSVIINPIGENQFSSPSRSKPGVFYFLHYDGTGLPLCNCEAGRFNHPCCHIAAVIAYCHSDLQRLWDHRRIFEARSLWLQIRQGRVNPKKYPRIRREMENITERHPVTTGKALCTRCGKAESDDLCPPCKTELRKIWPESLEFARELEQTDIDEKWRLKLGMGE